MGETAGGWIVEVSPFKIYNPCQMASTPPTSNSKPNHFRRRIIAIACSLGVAILMMGAKFYTYRLTHSSAIFSDALESIINVVAAAFALVSIWMAAQPPDPEHPYGHGKIEYFSAGFEGALIIFAAVGIFKTGIDHLLIAPPLANLQSGLVILVAASLVNLMLGLWLVRTGRRFQSLTLVADGKHVLTDVYTSVGVIAGLFLVQWTGWYWMDGAIACLVGINILLTGTRLVSQSFSALMDASDPELLDTISHLLENNRQPYWIDVHQLRAWRSGNFIHIDLHLVLPREFNLDEAHAEAKAVEQMLIRFFEGGAGVLVHMDPCEEQDCPVCRQYRCALRSRPRTISGAWNRQSLTTTKTARPDSN